MRRALPSAARSTWRCSCTRRVSGCTKWRCTRTRCNSPTSSSLSPGPLPLHQPPLHPEAAPLSLSASSRRSCRRHVRCLFRHLQRQMLKELLVGERAMSVFCSRATIRRSISAFARGDRYSSLVLAVRVAPVKLCPAAHLRLF